MNGRIIGSGEKTRYVLDGKDVTKEEFDKAFPDKPLNLSGDAGITAWLKPVVSDALAVNPRQVKAVMERNHKAGLHVDYKKDGRPILRSQGDKEALMRLHNVHDNNGGYRAGGPRS